jgi:hypothetical protein
MWLHEWSADMKQGTAEVAVLGVIAVLIVVGATMVYLHTSIPVATTSLFSSNPADGNKSLTRSSQSAPPACGYQDSSLQPQGCWADYLGYVPAGYVIPPHYPNGGIYPCLPGMDAGYCKQFQASCGNGLCDPNESCSTCPIDCLASGQTCDAYTGRAGNPGGVCQVTLNATG